MPIDELEKTTVQPELKDQTLIVVHGLWVPAKIKTVPGNFCLWGEGTQLRDQTIYSPIKNHPFALSANELSAIFPELTSAQKNKVDLTLPSRNRLPQASQLLLQEQLNLSSLNPLSLRKWKVECLALNPEQSMDFLVSLDLSALKDKTVFPDYDLLFWQSAAALAKETLVREWYMPAIYFNGSSSRRNAFSGWKSFLDAPNASAKFGKLAEAMPLSCFSFPMNEKLGKIEVNPQTLLNDFLNCAIDSAVRSSIKKERLSFFRPRTSHDVWLLGLTKSHPDLYISDLDARDIESSLDTWESRLQAASSKGLRSCLRLEPPEKEGKEWSLVYLMQATAEPSFMVPAEDIWTKSSAAAKLEEISGSNPEERMLSSLILAGQLYPPIAASLKKARPNRIALNADQAYLFLKDAAPVLANTGFGLILPPWWKSETAPRLSLSLNIKSNMESGLGMDSLINFKWRIALGDTELTEKEFETLSNLKIPLVELRGQWVEVDRETLQKAIDFLNQNKKGALPFREIFKKLRDGSNSQLAISELKAEGWLKNLICEPSAPSSYETLTVPQALKATLRPYQERGFSWLAFLQNHGFGACLADDMGLGKTIQSLALLLLNKEEKRASTHPNHDTGPALIVCPTSVVGNWRKEIERFAPSLKVMVHHGSTRKKKKSAFLRQVRSHDLVISTYALTRLDNRLLNAQTWSGIVLDEAQNIKNHQSYQSRAVRELKGGYRIALTGTPVENRLTELWSIMEFLNPGYLGGFEDFHKRFSVPIEKYQDARAANTLRRIAQPFILRRLKTDKSIISDLPEKMEMKIFCTLTREQATLYRAVVGDMMEKIESSEGIQRRGQVLSALTKLKQVLNHPAHFLKDNSALPKRSGKLERLTEMLEEVLSENDSALVFTQYAEMGSLLKRHFQETLLQESLFFHGGLSKEARENIVDRFQSGSAKILILTLKAGGLGLNLTNASHVFHFDRWWNPAVENQATDRAFRIGQTKKVQVHKYICLGTLEEKIDQMIESKKNLAEKVLGASETWLSELSNAELKNIFELRESAMGDLG